MTKTLKELREATGDLTKTFIGPAEVRELKKFASEVSTQIHSDLANILSGIEKKANDFGYTLGELDLESPFEDSANANYFLLTFANQNIVKNGYFSLTWAKVPAQQNPTHFGDSTLRYEIKLKFLEVTPEEIQRLIDDSLEDEDEIGAEEYENQDEPSEAEANIKESVENLDEAVRIKSLNRILNVKDGDAVFNFAVNSDGSLLLSIESLIFAGKKIGLNVPRNKAEDVISAIQDHFVKFVK